MNVFSQTNLIKNPSFEERQWDSDNNRFLLPKRESLTPCYVTDGDENNWHSDEITRCLGDYIWNTTEQPSPCFFPYYTDRKQGKTNGGCDGWYNPLHEDTSTPDYFNRNVAETGNPLTYVGYHVDVPNNWVNNWGANSDNHKQEPYDDNQNSIVDVGTEDAYVGLYNIRNVNDTNDIEDNWAEYITQRLDAPNNFKAHHFYRIKFMISWANEDAQSQMTGHYLRDICAYITEDDPFTGRSFQDGRPLNLERGTEGLVFNDQGTYFNQHGGTSGTQWQTFEGYYQPTEDKYFITIGNFQSNWNRDSRMGGPAIPRNNMIHVYYFIDAVEVTEIDTTCICEDTLGNPTYYITTELLPRDSADTACCYKVYLNHANLWNMCHVNKAKIYTVDVNPPFTETYKGEFTSGGTYFHNMTNPILIDDNLCFVEENAQKMIRVKLFKDNEQEPSCTAEVNLTTCCDCPQDRSSWLHYKVVRDGSCPDSGCRLLIMGLELPENITCYTHYQFETPDHILLPVKELYNTSDPFWQSTFCIPNGGPSAFKLYLMRGPYHLSNDCIIQGIAVCDSNTEVKDIIPMGCHTDCENDPWNVIRNYKINLPNGCEVFVSFRYRFACPTTNNFQDLEILDYSLVYNQDCLEMTTAEVYQAVLKYLIDKDPMGFNPLPGSQGCNDLWRIINASCWKDEIEYIGTGRCEPGDEGVRIVQKACDSVECCIQRIRVCRSFVDPKLTITPQGEPTIPDPYDCIYIPDEALNFDPLYPVMHTCHTACNWVDWSKFREAVGFDEIYVNNSITRFNLKGNTLILQCDSREECKLTIEFFDILGNTINVYTEQSRENLRKIDLSGLVTHTGFYTYRVSLDGILIGFGKFIKE